MAAPVILRTEVGDEALDLAEFEARVGRGEVSPQSLVRLPAVTGDRFVRACELELWQRLQDGRRAYFTRAFSLARFPFFTSALILVNLAAFLVTARGGTLELDDMVRTGGKVGPLVFDLGEVWRLFTANLLHRDGLHLGLNMFVLFNVGGMMENTYRTLDYLWLLVFSGLATMTASLLLNESVTIGASGMVFGCLGGVVAFGLKYRSQLSAFHRSVMGDAAIPTALGLLLIGLTSQGVDNWAHGGGLVAGLATGSFLRPRLLAEGRRWWWEPALRALPSVGLVLLLAFGQALFADALPTMRLERDDVYGFSIPVPMTWGRGATPLGRVAWYNGLPGLGRASFAAEAVEMPEGADAPGAAQRFVDERLSARALGPDVTRVRVEAPEPARVGDRDGVRVRAVVDETSGPTRLAAYFVPRGGNVYQLVFQWPADFPRYAHVVDQMLSGVRFEEGQALRRARAEALFFPNSGPVLARLGLSLLEHGDAPPAAEALATAVKVDPSNGPARVALSRAWLAAGDAERACAAARDAVVYAPDDVEALEAEARCELAQGHPRRALLRLQAARALEPKNAHLEAAERRLKETLPEYFPSEPAPGPSRRP
ncbi:MAG: rhomboid family intramembrane serine protease [Myxococcaceae bacterium]|jgi:rhomboid protease GluP|nr:rhomboid family intramembrane serine protease [Myxococcaceae bacterium]MCA3013324.1 rhomboid family intramembrane serine protease [Myxococcaceae bacterium]